MMAIKLRSLLRARPLALVLKALTFVGFLGLVKAGNFSLVSILFFLLAGLVLYSTPFKNNFAYLASFLVLVVIAPVALKAFSGNLGFLAVATLSGFLFYANLGLKNLFFIYRSRWHYLLDLGLFYLVTLVFFDAAGEGLFFWKLVLVFLIAVFLVKEFLKAISIDKSSEAYERALPKTLIASASSLLIVETFWVVGLLPLSILNSANLSILMIFTLLDILRRRIDGSLSRLAILTDATIFVLLTLLILATSRWSI